MRGKVERLGPVNLLALKELGELEERSTFLEGQRQDLVEALREFCELRNLLPRFELRTAIHPQADDNQHGKSDDGHNCCFSAPPSHDNAPVKQGGIYRVAIQRIPVSDDHQFSSGPGNCHIQSPVIG